ncbi:MAG: hypothetical protein ABIQ31_17810 [Ferruginibacter sp.]
MAKERNPITNSGLRYGIVRVRTMSFFVDETKFRKGVDIKVEFDQNFGLDIENEIFELRLRVYSFHGDAPSQKLSEIIVMTAFKVEGLADRFKNERLRLPGNFIISLLNMSISHSRALMAQHTAGTVYQDYILPIVNPLDVAKVFFPHIFDGDELKEEAVFELNQIEIPIAKAK